MAEQLHLIAVNEGDYGYSLTSPQIPGFVYGRPTAEEFHADLAGVLAFADAPDLPVVRHSAHRLESPEGREYLIRVAEDEHKGERFELAWKLEAALQTEQRHQMLAVPTVVTGEVQFLCALPTDRLSWIFGQLDPRGDTAVIVVSEGQLVWNLPVGHGMELGVPATSLEELGLSFESQVSDLRLAVANQKRLVLA